MISLCEQCRNHNWQYMQTIIGAYRDSGLERPHHIWCDATDRPEDLRFDFCQFYNPVEPSFSETHNHTKQKAKPHQRGHHRLSNEILGTDMNLQQQRLMDKPSIIGEYCPFCGRRAASKHHIVPRSQGGAKGPVVAVCGMDNVTGCHGLFHQHILHLDWDDERNMWVWLKTKEPTPDYKAAELSGWLPVRSAR